MPVNLSHPASKSSCPMFFKQWLHWFYNSCNPYDTVHATHEVLAWSGATLSLRPLRASPWNPWLLLHWATLEQHHGDVLRGYVLAMLCLCYGKVITIAVAAASIRREAVSRLPCQPEKNKCVCSSYSSSGLPASFAYPGFSEYCE